MEEDGDFFKWERGYFYWGRGGGGVKPAFPGVNTACTQCTEKEYGQQRDYHTSK